ncbi:MAG TPA: UDP-N-acetylmuramoyl-tripeptide--D-alanyl-D-alanine ligase [Chitinophagaceae bacterium]|nr:UDP-N-acetylmuramoyl-tripeptide--D-alanyl-D-alanine ligase [Chitinophagaceae bacterium]
MDLYDVFLQHPIISTDTRTVEPGSLFFALKGEKYDGNNFAQQALDSGAAYAVIQNPAKKTSDKFILVDDVLVALQALAKHHRNQLKTKIICVAGSNGKTTTKELIYRVLNSKFKTFATIGNLNNHIGVPICLLKLNSTYDFAVIEIGANHICENLLLCELAKPDFAVVTNCGKDHLEGFGSIEGVIKSNKEVYDYLKHNHGIAFVNQDDETLMNISNNIQRVFYGNISGKLVEEFPFIKFQNEYQTIQSNLLGSFQFYNIACAVVIGNYFGVNQNLIRDAIESYKPSNNRSQIIEWNGNKILLDAYNANPSSMSAMIIDFSKYPIVNKIVILGDMFELGEYSDEEHKEMIRLLIERKLDNVILVGKEFKKHNSPFIHFEKTSDLKDWLIKQNFKDFFFLVKGSRGIALENAFK